MNATDIKEAIAEFYDYNSDREISTRRINGVLYHIATETTDEYTSDTYGRSYKLTEAYVISEHGVEKEFSVSRAGYNQEFTSIRAGVVATYEKGLKSLITTLTPGKL